MKGINHIKMEQQQSDGAFVINVNSPGNFIAKEITFTGPVNIGGNIEQGGFTDVQIKTALEAIVGKDKVVLSADEVAEPVAARYAFQMCPEGCNLYSSEGLPATPFEIKK